MSRPLQILKLGSRLSNLLGLRSSARLAIIIGRILGPRFMGGKAQILKRNLARVLPEAKASELDQVVKKSFGNYGRYWAETFLLPSVSESVLDDGFSVVGFENISDTLDAGLGPILALPHLGGWEWGAAWLDKVADCEVVAVVEEIEPRDVFEWFSDLRSAYGIEVIPLSRGAFSKLTAAVKSKKIVCLLADRDIAKTGTEVEFFGENTMLPTGPALLSMRTGSPVLPTAIYFDGVKRRAVVGEPLLVKPDLVGAAAIAELAQRIAVELEVLIREGADQWYVLEPNWPESKQT